MAKHICVTGLRGIPDIMGGVETHCEELLPLIEERAPDYEIEVLGRRPYTGDKSYSYKGVAVTPLPSTTNKSLEAIISTFVGTLYARRKSARLLHIHAVGPALLAPVARLLGLKVLFTHHGADYDRAKWNGFAKFMLRTGEKLGVRFADHIIAVSPSLREKLAKAYPGSAKKITFIPNGAATLPPPKRPEADILADFGLEPGGYYLSVARLVPEKGLDYLAEVHAGVPEAPPLVVAGAAQHADPYADKLLAMGSDRLKFIGAHGRDVLGVLYRNAAMFILPSFHEGLPIAALEAMASETPVLLSDIDANSDFALHERHYFPVGDRTALTAKLRKLVADPLPGNEFTKGAAANWPEIAANTQQVYARLLSE